MRLHNHELKVFRNESFTLDFDIVNNDGSPYILGKYLQNPHICITISSVKYDTENRYLHNIWLPLTNVRKFENTQFVEVLYDDLNKDVVSHPIHYPNGVDTVDPILFTNDNTMLYAVSPYGDKIYKYYDEGEFKEYKLHITVAIPTSLTSQWIEQTYNYSIRLICGKSTEDYIKQLYESYKGDNLSDLAVRDMQIELVKAGMIDKDLNKPLTTFSEVTILLEPTKLYVESDENGGYYE